MHTAGPAGATPAGSPNPTACPQLFSAHLQEAISDKLGSFLQGMACFVGGMVSSPARRPQPASLASHAAQAMHAQPLHHRLPMPAHHACPCKTQVVAFIRGWDLSLVVLAAIPALVLAGGICGVFTAKLQVRSSWRRAGAALLAAHPRCSAGWQSVHCGPPCAATCRCPTRLHSHPPQAKASRAYGRAGAIAGEAVANIRTVAAFGREEATLRAYASALAEPTKARAMGL